MYFIYYIIIYLIYIIYYYKYACIYIPEMWVNNVTNIFNMKKK